MHVPADDHDGLAAASAVSDFVESWSADREAGCLRPLADYLRRFPGHEEAIAREFVALEREPAFGTAAGASASTPADAVDGEGMTLGSYRTVRLLGTGGQGEVWLADDLRLGRQVALKVLSAAAAATSRSRVERLRREAHTLARLAHPGICAVHAAELDGPRPFLVMQCIGGATLAAILADPAAIVRPWRAATVAPWLEFFREAASALQAAHALGIVHRDVKPANLMRTPAGAPVLLDFGIAHSTGAEAMALTQAGELFGTLPYMAPEVLAGREPAPCGDVYGLGVTMYEVFAGERPFVGATHEALRRAIERADVARLDRRATGVTAALGVVVATAMERDPGRRYATAAALAEDLRRLAAGEPIAASPPGVWLHARRWLRRHPVGAASLATLVSGLVVAGVLLAMLATERAGLLALRRAHRAGQLADEQPGLALNVATEAARAAPHPEIHDVLYRVLDACWEEHALWDLPATATGVLPCIAITADDRLVVRGLDNGTLELIAAASGKVERTVRHAADGWLVPAVAADGSLWTGASDGTVRWAPVVGGEVKQAFPLHAPARGAEAAIGFLGVAPRDARVASCGADGLVAVLRAGAEPVRCTGHVGGVSFAEFSPDGTVLATLGGNANHLAPGDRTVRVFDVASGALLHTFGPFPAWPHWVAWSPDGRQLAIAREEGCVEVHEPSGRAPVRTFAADGPVYWAAFSPDGASLLCGSRAGLAVYDVRDGTRRVLHDDFHDRSVFRGAFSADGMRLGVIAWDDTARVYDAVTWQPVRALRGVATRARALCWNHAGTRLWTDGGALQSWYTSVRPFLPELRGHRGRIASVRWSLDGSRLLSCGADGARCWDPVSGESPWWLAPDLPLRHASFDRSGERILLLAVAGPARLVIGSGEPRVLGSVAASAGWFLADGGVVLVCDDGTVRRFDGEGLSVRPPIACHDGPIRCSALHPGGRWLATGGDDGTVCVADLVEDRVSCRCVVATSRPDLRRVFGVAFSPDGRWLYGTAEDQLVRAISLADGRVVHSCNIGPTPGPLLCSPDGRELVVGAMWSGRLMRCSAPNLLAPRTASAQHGNQLVALRAMPDGALALSAAKDGTVSLFELASDRLVCVFHAAAGPLVDADISADGRSIATAAADGTIRIWPIDPLALALRVRPARDESNLQGR